MGGNISLISWASLVAQMVKNLPEMQKTRVQSLGQKDLLEKGVTTHSSILAWKIPWTEVLSLWRAVGLRAFSPREVSRGGHWQPSLRITNY